MRNDYTIIKLLASNAISSFSQGICLVAIPWYLIHHLDAYSLFGWVYGIVTFSVLFWQPLAGTIIDKYKRRNVLIGTGLTEGILLLSCLFLTSYLEDGALILALFAFSLMIFGFNIHYPNVYAFAQEITNDKNYERTNSLLEIQGQTTTMLAGFVAIILLEGSPDGRITFLGIDLPIGIQLEAWSLQEIILLDALTYFCSVLVLCSIRFRSKTKKANKELFKERVKEGFVFLKNNPSIFKFGTFSYSIFAVVLVYSFMINALYVEEYLLLGADTMASCEFLYGLGALSSGLLSTKFVNKVGQKRAITGFFYMAIFVVIGLAITKSIWITFLASLVLGITNAGVRILRISQLFRMVPNEKIGRTNSVFGMISIVERSVFILIFSLPFFSTTSGIPIIFWIFTAFLLISLYMVKRSKI